jgi:hypothetical protein
MILLQHFVHDLELIETHRTDLKKVGVLLSGQVGLSEDASTDGSNGVSYRHWC